VRKNEAIGIYNSDKQSPWRDGLRSSFLQHYFSSANFARSVAKESEKIQPVAFFEHSISKLTVFS